MFIIYLIFLYHYFINYWINWKLWKSTIRLQKHWSSLVVYLCEAVIQRSFPNPRRASQIWTVLWFLTRVIIQNAVFCPRLVVLEFLFWFYFYYLFLYLKKKNKNRCVCYKIYFILSNLFQLSAQSTVSMTQTRATSAQGDHVRLWLIERIVSASFLSLIPAALVLENKFIDIVLAAAIVMHTHW